MRFAYVLPDPATYTDWHEFSGDLACIQRAGYDAVELQVADPAELDEPRVHQAVRSLGLALCAVQTGGTYATRGNCLATADAAVRRRTTDLLLSFVDLAARWGCLLVFGSLQGRRSDEPNGAAAQARIVDAVAEVGRRATGCGVTVAFEPVQHGEVGFHNTIAEVASVVRGLRLPGIRMMVDTFHMNIEERDMLAPLAGIAGILAHVHLSETNRAVLGEGHWPTAAFLAELDRLAYGGTCSVGVYNSQAPRRDCILRCMEHIRTVRERSAP